MSLELSKKEFDVLVALIEAEETLTQRQLVDITGHSLSTVNRIVKKLSDGELIADGMITDLGRVALEPYRAKRAIFIAAGFGSRLVPITLNTPKPLVRVNNKRIIDSLIDACLLAGIDDIYIVRGYLAEQFDILLNKYPMIKFLENPVYNEANNISSAMIARNLMQNAYVLEADLMVTNPKVIKKYNYESTVLGIWKERTDDWCFAEKNGYITEEKIGGLNCYQMVGIYYWNGEDGAKLAKHLKEAYEQPGGKERYWETVPNQVYRGQYKIKIRPCTDADIAEIDTFRELKALDHAYDV